MTAGGAIGGVLEGGEALIGRPFSVVALVALASLFPLAFMSTTAFVKISTVVAVVRGALGAPSVPSNAVVMALSVALTVTAMAPVGSQIVERAGPVLMQRPKDPVVLVVRLWEAARDPMRRFLERNASSQERVRFLGLARSLREGAERDAVSAGDFSVLVPAFVTSELLSAFRLGFAVYLPLLVIDLVVANVLLALGMQTLSPTQVSLPFKLLLFVSIDGWGLLSQALLAGYR